MLIDHLPLFYVYSRDVAAAHHMDLGADFVAVPEHSSALVPAELQSVEPELALVEDVDSAAQVLDQAGIDWTVESAADSAVGPVHCRNGTVRAIHQYKHCRC